MFEFIFPEVLDDIDDDLLVRINAATEPVVAKKTTDRIEEEFD